MTTIRTVKFENFKTNNTPQEYVLELANANMGGVTNVFHRFAIRIRDMLTLHGAEASHRIWVKVPETPHTSADAVLDAALETLQKTQGCREISRERIEVIPEMELNNETPNAPEIDNEPKGRFFNPSSSGNQTTSLTRNFQEQKAGQRDQKRRQHEEQIRRRSS